MQEYKKRGRYFYVMKDFKGGDLKMHKDERGYLTEEEGKNLLRQVGAAVQYLHGEGIAHRDIKVRDNMFIKVNVLFIWRCFSRITSWWTVRS
jgi:serine/threonine protein kinase